MDLNNMLHLYLIRHGQTAWNIEGRAQGHTDIELDESGRAQAQQLAARFQDRVLDLVISSDLRRAHETAHALATTAQAPIVLKPDLRERSFGDWEGLDYRGVREQLNNLGTDHTVSPPNGESLGDVWTRLDPIIEHLHTLSGHVAVVTHGGTCGLLLAKLLGAPIHCGRSFRFGNTAVTELRRRPDGGWTLEVYADTSHLSAPSSPMIDTTVPRV